MPVTSGNHSVKNHQGRRNYFEAGGGGGKRLPGSKVATRHVPWQKIKVQDPQGQVPRQVYIS